MNNVFLAHDKLTLFVPGYAIPPSLDFMQYAALEEKNCDVICIRPIEEKFDSAQLNENFTALIYILYEQFFAAEVNTRKRR